MWIISPWAHGNSSKPQNEHKFILHKNLCTIIQESLFRPINDLNLPLPCCLAELQPILRYSKPPIDSRRRKAILADLKPGPGRWFGSRPADDDRPAGGCDRTRQTHEALGALL